MPWVRGELWSRTAPWWGPAPVIVSRTPTFRTFLIPAENRVQRIVD